MTQKQFKLTDIGFVRSDGKSKEIGIVTNEGEFIELKKIVEVMNELYEENQSLKQSDTIADLETQIMHLKEELDYYKNKCASLETGLFEEQRRSSEAKRVLEERFGDSDSNILEKW